MKTKSLITVFFVFSNIVNAFSQDYHPFLDHSSWIIYDWVSCCRNPKSRTIAEGTDVVIGGTTYKKFIVPLAAEGITDYYIREDVKEKKVYKLVNGTEILLYDFSLETGDTISYAGNTFTATVDSLAVNGGSRKRITLISSEKYCNKQLTQVWIEGVGSNKHPFYPDQAIKYVCSSGGGYHIFTKCSFQKGNHIYGPSDCSFPQYHPLLNNPSWIVTSNVACCESPENKVIAEGTNEVIGGKTYKKFIDPFAFSSNGEIYLREDINLQRVYRLVEGQEFLLYDFSLGNSEKITLDGVNFIATVDQIDVIGGTRKRITLKSAENDKFCGESATQVWIEGVGSVAHSLYPAYNINAETCSGGGFRIYTTCSFQNGVHVYGPSDCDTLLSTEDFSSEADNIQLYPNPASDMVNIQFGNGIETLESITIYNLLGKPVQKVSGIAANQSSLSVGSLANGMYMVEIITQSKMKITKKLIVN